MMFTQSPPVNPRSVNPASRLTNRTARSTTPSESSACVARADNTLLQVVLENWIDGVLVLTEQGKWVQANVAARRICDRLMPKRSPSQSIASVPEVIWRICLSLIRSRSFSAQQSAIVESEVTVDDSTVLRVRVRWLNMDDAACPYLLVILEDRYQSTRNLARAEAMRYNLTPRETKVWSLRRLGYTYGRIAKELFITLDTVKKHMKNIRAKQQFALCMEDFAPDNY